MKVAVYAIARNEESNVQRWAKTTAEADYRIVTDTGSTDRTAELLRSCGVTVKEAAITPWRFDEARNISLSHVPEDVDVCISLDLDEILLPGWRQALERAWKAGTTSVNYVYVSKFEPDGVTPQLVFYGFKIHARHGYRWVYPIHEVLEATGPHVEVTAPDLVVHHYQQPRAERDASYLSLLQQQVAARPDDARSSYNLGKGHFGLRQHAKCIAELQRYLALPTATFAGERSHALRMIAYSKRALGHSEEEILNLFFRAATESPGEREPWAILAAEMAAVGNWPNSLSAAVNALRNRDTTRSYLIEPWAWGGELEKLLERSALELGIPRESLPFSAGA